MRRYSFCAAFLLLILSLAGCEEDVAGPTEIGETFSLYGVFNPRLLMQTVLVAPVEDLLAPNSGKPLDAVVTSTDMSSGEIYVWRDSIVANATGQLDHIYWADFTPGYGSRHRMEVMRSDGKKSTVNVEVPGEVRVEDSDLRRQDLRVRILGFDNEDFVLPRIETIYDVSFYHKDNPDTVCNTPREQYTISHKGTEKKINNGWELIVDLNIFYETMRSYYYEDNYEEWMLEFENPAQDGLALLRVRLAFTVGSPEWNPPGGDPSDERVLVHPGTLSNVENGYGLVVGGYNDEAALYPSSKLVGYTPFFDFIQRDGGDHCLGTL